MQVKINQKKPGSLILVFILYSCLASNIFAQNLGSTLKVMTYNIWNGFDWGKDTVRNLACIEWIRSKNPDVLALQELCGYTEEKLRMDAAKWGHPYVAILKKDGYPVGLTSKSPLEVKERVLDSLWHGMLHVKTFGIDFYVVHLSPADCDFRLKEAKIITKIISDNNQENFIVLGDFNAHSPFDGDLLIANQSLLHKYQGNSENSQYSNLRNGAFDFSVISTFLSLPSIDLCPYFEDASRRYSFPTPALVGIYQTAEEVEVNKERIDYILMDSELAQNCTRVTIYNDGKTTLLSDHFPVMAIFSF